jgi:hypothetical protein
MRRCVIVIFEKGTEASGGFAKTMSASILSVPPTLRNRQERRNQQRLNLSVQVGWQRSLHDLAIPVFTVEVRGARLKISLNTDASAGVPGPDLTTRN